MSQSKVFIIEMCPYAKVVVACKMIQCAEFCVKWVFLLRSTCLRQKLQVINKLFIFTLQRCLNFLCHPLPIL